MKRISIVLTILFLTASFTFGGVGEAVSEVGTLSSMPTIILSDYNFQDHLREVLDADDNTFFLQRTYEAAVNLIIPGSTTYTTDATLELIMSDAANISEVYCHVVSPDDNQIDENRQMKYQGGNSYSDRFSVEPRGALDISSYFDLISLAANNVGSPIYTFPPQVGLTAPRLIIDRIDLTFNNGAAQTITASIELPRYDKYIVEHLEDLSVSGLVGYTRHHLYSPADITIVDTLGNRVGVFEGQKYTDIPHSISTGDGEPEIIVIFSEDDYDLFIYGTGEGTFDYEYNNNTLGIEVDKTTAFYDDVPVTVTTVCSTSVGYNDQFFDLFIDTEGDGVYDYSIPPSTITSVGQNGDENNFVLNDMMLHQNYPNPFNPATKIKFNITREGRYSILVYNTLGKKIADVVNGYFISGSHVVEFNAKDLSSGIYLYRLIGEGMSVSKKMVILK